MGSPASSNSGSVGPDSGISRAKVVASGESPVSRGGSGGFLSNKLIVSRSAFVSPLLRPSRRQSRGNERQHQFVMPRNRKAVGLRSFVVAGGGRGTLHYILQRAVVLNKVEVGCGDGAKRHAEIPHHGDSFQENFRQQNSGSPIQINTAGMH